MRKLLIVVMAFFIITGVVAGIYSFRNDKAIRESKVSQSDEDLYPENLRPIVATEEEDASDIQNENKEEEEIVSDENFVEFEIEGEPEEEPEELIPEEKTEETKPEEEKPEEAVTENTPVDTPVAAGSQIEISDYRVRLRAFPSEDSPVLAICKEGETGILTEYGESWSVIKINGREGYIHNGLWKAK